MNIRAGIARWTSQVTNNGASLLGNLQTAFSNITSAASAVMQGVFDGDVIGINADQIPTMKQAIQDYVTHIDNALDEVVNTSNPAEAFADSEMQAACTEFLQAVVDVCKNYTSNLLKFYDTLTEIQTQYVENQATMASNLKNDQSAEMRSTVEAYTAQS